ncbi:putative serine/threonine-protein kinase SIS8 [Bienertia sinuspersici]
MKLMCNKGVKCLGECLIEHNNNELLNQAAFVAMDNNLSVSSNMANLGNDEASRMKFLCSFGGSILPRPQDGKLRYVGGETRIVSVPRSIRYDELMGKMRELFDSAAILKYQQPDEDLDALVSVVNDDDVINMMEEYDKLGSGDGFTRLRIFLFSHPEQDVSQHYMDGDERDTERRYVDALNSLCDSPEYRRQQFSDSPTMTPVDEVHIADQFFNSMNLEGSVHNQRNYEMGMPQYNLRQLAVPRIGSGQHLAATAQQMKEEAPWSPAYYSPRCVGPGPHDTRAFMEYPSSPSSARYRMPDESTLQQVNTHVQFDHQHQYPDNVAWLHTGGTPVDRGGFPGNILNGHSVVDGPNVCEHCKMTFQRNPSSSDFHWKAECQSTVANGFPQVANHCVECLPKREPVMLNTDPKVQQSLSGVGRMGEHYNLDGSGATTALGPSNLSDGHLVPTSYAPLEDPRYVRTGADLGGEVFHGQAGTSGLHAHIPLEERGVYAANMPYSYGTEIPHQVLHSHPSAQALWRAPAPVHVPTVYDSSNLQPRNGMSSLVVPRANVEASPRYFVGVDHSPWVESPQRRMGVEGSATPEYPYSHYGKLSPAPHFHEVHPTFPQDPLRNTFNMIPPPIESVRPPGLNTNLMNENMLSSGAKNHALVQRDDTINTGVKLDERSIHHESSVTTHLSRAESPAVNGFPIAAEQNNNAENSSTLASHNANKLKSIRPGEGIKDGVEPVETNACPPTEKEDLSFLPELVASAKKAKLESAERVRARAQEDGDPSTLHNRHAKIANIDETASPDVDGTSEGGSSNENIDTSKIEHTKAEEEAFAKGLQTIKNADLEEIRVLGSGTYGSVYHGKWKGSDVAIKRIKASCFAGRPSERERLIAEFWKEAFLLSSLHHPNVVSFYGIVRDGPDGTLATVTEFMINGSLKQYLQKKDRTIDRRKRLIIAMDAAFGMEYLHGKNIVHFDLKCENLLVNMRDPHRPVCKIGDLGLSKVKQNTLVSGGVRGTLPWMAPELLSGKSNMVTEKIDVYSFGVVMWELLTGEEPYSDMHCASIIGGIVNNTLRPQIPTWCDPEWKSLMESCWAPDPAGRPSFTEISHKLRSMAAAMNVK